ncbi:hypothetical protein [Nocardiopsis protaetiae]|uniref:hypothetical protein n=1 Tax=Nocardiopsis protaetiae TaxID=3382270 RepID=UPI00387AD24D
MDTESIATRTSTPRTGTGAALAVCAAAGPLGMAAAVLLLPYSFADAPEVWIAAVAGAGARTEAAFWGLLVWGVLAPVGVIAAGLVARRGAPRTGTAGLVAAFAGAAAFGAAGWGYDGIALAASRAGLDPPAVAALMAEVDRLQAPTASAALVLAMFVGFVLLGAALWIGRDVPRWAAVVLIVSPVVILLGGMFSMPVNAAGFALVAVGFGACGAVLARGARGPRPGTRSRWALAAVGTAAPLSMAVWALVIPSAVGGSYAQGLPRFAAAEGRVEASLWMLFAFSLCCAVGAVVTGLVSRRGAPRTGTAGLVATYLGFAALNVGGSAYAGAALASIRAGNPDAVTGAVLSEVDALTVALGPAVFVPLMFAGVVLLGIGLWAGREVPRWSVAALWAAFPVIAVGTPFSMGLNAAGWVLLAVGFGAAGAAWARGPELDEGHTEHIRHSGTKNA